jgi:DNA invertase Pin-like site-specific DNA recombinase
MKKVVILARVSTDRQDYQRQVNELNEYCDKVGWDVVKVFTNKVSGTKGIEERT